MLHIKSPADYYNDLVAHLELDSAKSKGHVLQRSTSDETKVVTSTSGDGQIYLLMNDVTSDGQTFQEKMQAVRVQETKTTEPCTILKVVGQTIVTDNVTGTPSVGEKVTISSGVWTGATSGDIEWGEVIDDDYDGTSGDYELELYTEPNTAS